MLLAMWYGEVSGREANGVRSTHGSDELVHVDLAHGT